MVRRFVLLSAAVLVGAAALAEDGGEGLVEQKSRNVWHFRAGPVMAPRVRVSVRGPQVRMPRVPEPAAGVGENAPASEPSAGYAERQYVDGYVKPDDGTGDPDSIVFDLTWDWGADDLAVQHSAGRMEFHTDMTRWNESVESSSYRAGCGFDGDRDVLLGVEAMGGWTFFDDGAFDAAVDAGFRFYGSGCIDAKTRYGTTFTTTRDEYRFVDSYDASGWTDSPSGAHTGTSGGPGRVIGATPTRREELMDTSSSTEERFHSGRTKLDYRIWDLRLGPTLGWQAADRLAIRGGVYGLLGLVDASLKTTANASDGNFRASDSNCAAVFGMAFGLSAQVNITDNLFLVGGAEYDWWTNAVDLNAGGANAKIKLSDMSVSLGLGLEF